MTKWDDKYQKAGRGGVLFGNEPNAYLRDKAPPIGPTPGRSALCLADGDGRNGRWLAAQGYEVTAIDVSAVGTMLARQDDLAAGVTVNRHVADLSAWSPPEGAGFDLTCLVYLQCEGGVRRQALRVAWACLKPGGLFVFEGFAAAGAGRCEDGLGPRASDLLYEIADLEQVVPCDAFLELLHGRIKLNEGRQHQGTGTVIRALARKA